MTEAEKKLLMAVAEALVRVEELPVYIRNPIVQLLEVAETPLERSRRLRG